MTQGRTIAVANMKGGVGKTTTVVMLADAFAARGSRVLVIDLDAQANVSFCLAGNDLLSVLIREDRTIGAYLEDTLVNRRRRALSSFVRGGVSDTTRGGTLLDISLIASDPSLRLIERELIVALTEKGYGLNAIEGQIFRRIEKELPALQAAYDIVLFDCAPGVSPLNEAAIRSVDLVIVPTIPDSLSTLGLSAFCRSIWHGTLAAGSSLPRPKRLPRVLATRRQRIRQHQEKLDAMEIDSSRRNPPYRLLKTIIPQANTTLGSICSEKVGATYLGKYGAANSVLLEELTAEIMKELNSQPEMMLHADAS
ncbi:AAA family ATPase [Xanthobacter sp. KR7-225]|uniref:ParA family protein n=1 Tax=Xanthobacter sp. KR7-225 TaxID=3156613 RepID=UPI0032B566E8